MRNVLVPAVPACGERVALGPAEAHHLVHVIRLRPGEVVRVTDGAGNAAVARFDGRSADGEARLVVTEALAASLPPPRIVLLGCPKPALLEEALQLGTEAGCTCFVLVRARYSPPGSPRPDRLERVVRAAVTQCGRADLPVVEGPWSLSDALRRPDVASTPSRWLAAPGGPPGSAHDGPVVLAVGPEGGWSAEEQVELADAGFAPMGLGPHVLRTPTAVVAALTRVWSPESNTDHLGNEDRPTPGFGKSPNDPLSMRIVGRDTPSRE